MLGHTLSSKRKVEPSGNFSFRFLIAELGIASGRIIIFAGYQDLLTP